MKYLFTFLALITCSVFPQGLREVITDSFSSLNDIYFADENVGWTSGYSEAIYKTTDGGVNWERLTFNPSSEAHTFYALQFLDQNTGFVGGGYSTIPSLRKTTDGGDTWTNIIFPGTYPVKTINFLNEQTGWVLASSSNSANVFKTTDGGTNWTKVLDHTTGDLEDLKVLPSGRGICLGGGVGKNDIYYTADGNTWTKAASPSFGGFTYTRLDPHAVYMVDENLIYTCGWGSYIGLQPGIFLKSTDSGITWNYMMQLPENRQYQNSNAIYFKDAENGLAFGGGSYEGTIATRTTDAGVNWIPFETGLGFSVQSCFGIGDKVWITGGNGCIAVTTDFGNTWNILTPMIGTTINAIEIIDNTIYAGGYSGVLYKSTDKGESWTSGFTTVGKVCPTINGMHFLNESLGFFAKNNQMVVKTTDGGATFTRIMKDTSATGTVNSGIYFMDENTGFVSGRYANNGDIIYKTTDNGLNWSSTKDIALENLNNINFYDKNLGIAVANDSKILYTTNGGDNWNLSTINNLSSNLDILSVDFASATHAVAVGENCVMISNDAGATWQYYHNDVKFESILFKTENEGWAVGQFSILYTTDGGNNWEDKSDTLVTAKNTLKALALDNNGYLWIGGGSSIFTFSPLVSVNDISEVPESFELSQNYPNPFNPETNISYSVSRQAKITVKVYDILGNLISELVNDYKPAGTYSIAFDGSKFSSGIYFCVMNADGKLFTRKMTLLK